MACGSQVRAFSFASGGLAAAQRLHERLLSAVSRAPAALFLMTPAGRILNRFSSDAATADDSLPFILNILLAVAFSLLGVLVVLTWSQPILALTFLPIAIVYRWLQVTSPVCYLSPVVFHRHVCIGQRMELPFSCNACILGHGSKYSAPVKDNKAACTLCCAAFISAASC